MIPWIFFPDRRIGWLVPAVAAGIYVLRSQPIDLICSTYSDTITAHLIAYVLKMVSGKQWVADFQDPWSEPYVSSFPTALHRNIAQRIEQAILKKADHAIVTTSAVREAYAQKYPSLVRTNVSVIPIGFDSAPFHTKPSASPRSSFRITHFGVFWGSRSPAPFLKGLAQAIKIDRRLAGSIEVKFLGNFDPEYRAMTEGMLRDYGLRGTVFLEGFVPYMDGVKMLLDSDVLLLVADDTEFGKRLVPCKLFDYLAADKPILGLVPDGETARIVRGANAGMIVSPTDVSRIADAIVHLYRQWQEGHLRPATDKKYLQRFSCQETTKQFASLLNRLIASREIPLSQGEER
jgi:glycosyltransferase involved in cell wall biosynthesis